MTVTRRNAKHEKAARLRAEGHAHDSIADAVGVTVRTVERWQSKGILPDPPSTNGNGNGNGEAMTLTEARTRKEAALAGLREIELRRQRESLVDRDEAELFVRDHARRMRLAFEGFADVHGPRIAGELGTDTGATALALAAEVRAFLTNFSEEISNVASSD